MAMTIECPECNGIITAENALNKSWADPKLVFGCPHCNTFFDIPRNPFDGFPTTRFWWVILALAVLMVIFRIDSLLNKDNWANSTSIVLVILAVVRVGLHIYRIFNIRKAAATLHKLST